MGKITDQQHLHQISLLIWGEQVREAHHFNQYFLWDEYPFIPNLSKVGAPVYDRILDWENNI